MFSIYTTDPIDRIDPIDRKDPIDPIDRVDQIDRIDQNTKTPKHRSSRVSASKFYISLHQVT